MTQPIHIEPSDIKRIPLTLMQPLPVPTTCQHAQVSFGKPEKREDSVVVDCMCLSCGHAWLQVKVRTVPIAEGGR